MTEDRLREIALAMEGPLDRLAELDNLLIVMVDQCRPGLDNQSKLYSFLQRNLGDDLREIRVLWREFFELAVEKEDKPPLKAVED